MVTSLTLTGGSTRRCSFMVWTMGLCVLYPQYTLLFQLNSLLDIMRMWMKVYRCVHSCTMPENMYVYRNGSLWGEDLGSTVFSLIDAVAFIVHFGAVFIQGWHLFRGSVYYFGQYNACNGRKDMAFRKAGGEKKATSEWARFNCPLV